MHDLPQRIRRYRKQEGLTAKALGLLVHSDRQNVYAWERAANPTTPSAPALFALADLGIITVAERDQIIRGVAA